MAERICFKTPTQPQGKVCDHKRYQCGGRDDEKQRPPPDKGSGWPAQAHANHDELIGDDRKVVPALADFDIIEIRKHSSEAIGREAMIVVRRVVNPGRERYGGYERAARA